MTISISNASVGTVVQRNRVKLAQERRPGTHTKERSLADRFIFLVLCIAIVLSTLAFGTVHSWSLALFYLGAALVLVLWIIDAWQLRVLRLSRNALQWSLLGIVLIGLVQLLPSTVLRENPSQIAQTLSLDAYSTRLVIVKIIALLIYFAAALIYIDSPQRLRLLVRIVTIFGFLLAIFGLTQSFASPNKIYWFREPPQSLPFGPFINRHHFAGYMELALAVPLGLLFTGAVERDKKPLYAFATGLMCVALVMTGSRGGMISLMAEVAFVLGLGGLRHKVAVDDGSRKSGFAMAFLMRVGLALALILALLTGALLLGGESSLSRIVGTADGGDPTTGRAHFWNVTLHIIREYPLLGSGLGSYGLVYTRYDTRNGLFRLEQAHNDYLQVFSDSGVAGAILGMFFLIMLFGMGLTRCRTEDLFRRGVATGALAGCFAVLVHSFFDFTLHTTSNALLFLIMAAFATLNGRVEHTGSVKHRVKRRRSHSVKRLPVQAKEDDQTKAAPTSPEGEQGALSN